MTREEAIRELKADYCGNRIICELYPDQCNREDCEIWWAIKALENAKNDNLTPESSQNVPNQAFKMQKSDVLGDKISRQAAIDAVNNIMPTKEGFLEPSEVLCELMQLPLAQQETCDTCKHGYFGDSQCENCRVRFTSHYERRNDDDRNG